MMRTFLCAIIALAGATARAQPPDGEVTSETATKKLIHAILVKEGDEKPITKYSTDTVKLEALWKGSGLKAGDKIRAVWIAEDLGIAEKNNSRITESVTTAYKPDDDGAFALGRPKEGWPSGKYRLEIYVNSKLAESVKFTIEPGVTIEVAH